MSSGCDRHPFCCTWLLGPNLSWAMLRSKTYAPPTVWIIPEAHLGLQLLGGRRILVLHYPEALPGLPLLGGRRFLVLHLVWRAPRADDDMRILFKTAEGQFLNAQNKREALTISPA